MKEPTEIVGETVEPAVGHSLSLVASAAQNYGVHCGLDPREELLHEGGLPDPGCPLDEGRHRFARLHSAQRSLHRLELGCTTDEWSLGNPSLLCWSAGTGPLENAPHLEFPGALPRVDGEQGAAERCEVSRQLGKH
jgi:hypothetical protein